MMVATTAELLPQTPTGDHVVRYGKRLIMLNFRVSGVHSCFCEMAGLLKREGDGLFGHGLDKWNTVGIVLIDGHLWDIIIVPRWKIPAVATRKKCDTCGNETDEPDYVWMLRPSIHFCSVHGFFGPLIRHAGKSVA